MLKKEQIVISDETVGDHLFWLSVEEGRLYVKDIPVGSFEKARLYPGILINALHLSNFKTDPSISFFPKTTIEKLDLFYSPLYPVKVFLRGNTSFGEIEGELNIKTKRGFIDIFGDPKELRRFLRLKKVKEGHYRYAFSY